jgi:signal transduction histidine kinase
MRLTEPFSDSSPRTRRPLLLFAIAVLLPGLVLAALGFRTLAQDKRLADGQVRERLDRAAERTVAALERELRRWEATVAQVPVEPLVPDRLPSTIRETLTAPPGAAVVSIDGQHTHVLPDRGLLWEPDQARFDRPRADPPLPSALLVAERLELQQRDYLRAAAAYQQLLTKSDERLRAAVLVRLARTWRKAGRAQEARRAYRDLERCAGLDVAGAPADLVARYELCLSRRADAAAADAVPCSLALYSDLVQGGWSLEKPWYAIYAMSVRERLEAIRPAPSGLHRLIDLEARKRLLSEAVERGISRLRSAEPLPQSGHCAITSADRTDLIFWRAAGSVDRCVALVFSSEFLSDRLWPKAFASVLAEDVDLALLASDGSTVFASAALPPASAEGRPLMTSRTFQDGDSLWRLQLWPRHPDALYTDVRRRQGLYVAMLAVMVASLVVATILTLRTVGKELEVARLKSQFVSAVSHEFRTPLTGIRQFSEMLLHDRIEADERRHHYYALILGASERLSRLVENVLDFARIEEGRQEYHLTRLETTAWLRGVAADFQGMLAAGKALEIDVPDGLPSIIGDGQALGRAIHNLLDNAVKYSPSCATVWLYAESCDGWVTIRVRDLGVGIPAHEQRHVFERFFRGTELSHIVKGAGLGLSLVRHIVAAHHATLDFESTPGRGTTFVVRVPCAGDAETSGVGAELACPERSRRARPVDRPRT